MKRVFALVLTLATALGLAACNSGGGESGENVVRIGIFEPATGDNGAGGKQEMLGMQYANKETPTVDIGGTTYTVELVYADNGSDPAKAPTAAAELVSKDVSVVLGSYGSTVSLAGGPVFGEAGVPGFGRPGLGRGGCPRHWRRMHQSPDYGRERVLLPDLLPGSVPGNGVGKFRTGEILCEKSLLPG